jgi:hypothetical protein
MNQENCEICVSLQTNRHVFEGICWGSSAEQKGSKTLAHQWTRSGSECGVGRSDQQGLEHFQQQDQQDAQSTGFKTRFDRHNVTIPFFSI